jgi:hypothetical protein
LIAPAGEKDIALDEEAAGPLSSKGCEHRREIAFISCPRHEKSQSDCARRILHGCRIVFGIGVVRIDQHRDDLGRRHQLVQKPDLLGLQRAGNQVKPCQIAARAAEAGDQAPLDRVDTGTKHDRNRRGRRLGRQRGQAVTGDDHGDWPANQIRRQGRQAIVLTVCPTVFDGDVLTYDIAAFGQRLAEAGQHWPALRERRAAEKPDHRHRWLLCARRERPRGCAAEECNEVAPSHAIALEAKPTKEQRCASQPYSPTIGNGYSDPRLSGNRWLPQTTCAFFLFGLRRAHRSKETSRYRFVSPYWTAPRIELIGYWVIETTMETLVW